MTTFNNRAKNSTSQSNRSKNSTTVRNFLRHGKEPLVGALEEMYNRGDLDNYTFENVAFMDGERLEDATFTELTDTQHTNRTRL